jgi:hypothetical protein
LSQTLEVAYELIQVRNDYSIGRPTGRGIVVQGTEKAMRDEFEWAFRELMMGGEKGKEWRERTSKMRDEIEKDAQSGESHLAMIRLANTGI